MTHVQSMGGFQLLRPADFFVSLIYIALFALFLVLSLENIGEAGSAVIQSQGVEYRYSLGESRTLVFQGPVGTTVVEIDGNGHARFVSSDCRDQICVNRGELGHGGEWAACLPNRVILRLDVAAEENADIDATAF